MTYTETFTESGLPSGTNWSVTFNGITKSSGMGSIAFAGTPNGSYAFTVGSVGGYVASPASGTSTVSGAGGTKAVTFTAMPVGTSPPSSTFLGLSETQGYAVVGGVVAAIIVGGLAVVLWGRKGKASPDSVESSSAPRADEPSVPP